MTTTARFICVNVAFPETSLGKEIKQIIGEPVLFVATQQEADLILFTEVRQIKTGFDENKAYAFLKMNKRPHSRMSHNVHVLEDISLPIICKIISEISQTLLSNKAAQANTFEEPAVELQPDALNRISD